MPDVVSHHSCAQLELRLGVIGVGVDVRLLALRINHEEIPIVSGLVAEDEGFVSGRRGRHCCVRVDQVFEFAGTGFEEMDAVDFAFGVLGGGGESGAEQQAEGYKKFHLDHLDMVIIPDLRSFHLWTQRHALGSD